MIINSRNDKSMPMNSEIMFDVSRIIKPKKLVVPYYTLGTENVAWVAGYSQSVGAQSKESDHLLKESYEGGPGQRSYVTDDVVDLTNIKTLYWDMVHTILASNFSNCQFIASTEKLGFVSVFDARTTISAAGIQIASLDVSSLTGNFYVRVHCTTNTATASQIETYRVWGEG